MTLPLRVLVVDDETVFAGNIAKLLTQRGFTVDVATSGAGAVAAVRAHAAYDVVLLDVAMPEMDGIAVLRTIKSLDPALAVIMLTGQATVETGLAAIRAGALDYLLKPCEIEALTEKLRTAADVAQIRRRPVLWPRQLAGELMLSAFCRLATDDPLSTAMAIFTQDRRKMAAETLFVVDDTDALSGGLTQKMLVDAAQAARPEAAVTWERLRQHPEWLPPGRIGDLMHPVHDTAAPAAPLEALARTMVEKHLRSVPVIEEGRVLGVVRLQDVLRYVALETGQEARS